MMAMLLIAGLAVLGTGLLAIGFGIPVRDFSFGSTLILVGAIAACTGAILIALSVLLRELRIIARRLAPAVAGGNRETHPLIADNLAAADRDASGGKFPFDAEPIVEDRDNETLLPSSSNSSSSALPPWQDEVATRDRSRARTEISPGSVASPEPAELDPPVKPRRNLLFSSSSRKERERAMTRSVNAGAGLATGMESPDIKVSPRGTESPARPTFEDAWPQSERSRSESPLHHGGHLPPAIPETSDPGPLPVTVLKSGIVDGMAYSLYSDGSIEAQMPEGMMRFASIDELRSHLDQRP